ncbi:MAG: NUDIX hydrolase [Nocardioidaceae bacterium]
MEVPEQPTLRDGDVVLRPWRDEDIDPARLQHDEEMAKRFGFARVIPSHEQHEAAVRGWREGYANGRSTVAFVVERDGHIAGGVDVRQQAEGGAHLSWTLYAGHGGRGTMTRAVRLLVAYAFDDLGAHRVEAYVHPDNARSLRVAARAGLRREGLVRGRNNDDRRDAVLLARLADDPDPFTPGGFTGVLNAFLPTKRVIAQGVIRDQHGRVLLCEPTYKKEWDLPGGVVEPHESPRAGLAREIREELGLDLEPGRLVTVNWLRPWRGWDDACAFVFEAATLDADSIATLCLQPTEIRAVHWCDLPLAHDHVAPVTARLLTLLAGGDPVPPYLEAGYAGAGQ